MRRCVRFKNLKNEEAMAHVGPQRHRKKKNVMVDAYHVVYSSLFVNVRSSLACVFENTLNDLN